MCYFIVIKATKYFFAYLYICILVFFCLFDGMHLPKIQKQMQRIKIAMTKTITVISTTSKERRRRWCKAFMLEQ